jgi:aminoglycoside phosphotransferase (APT) family kinase protein
VTTRRSLVRVLAFAMTFAVIAACTDEPITETPFERMASDAASTLSAAAETLRQLHATPAKLTVEYGEGAMINYAEQVTSVPDELPRLEGEHDPATVQTLVGLF